MLTRAVKQRLADDVQLWLADGVVSPEVAGVLRQRYEAQGFGLVTVVKYLGIAGGAFCAFGLLGVVGFLVGSEVFGGVLVGAVGCGLMAGGIALSREVRNRYAFSSRAVTALGAMAFASGVLLLCRGLHVDDKTTAVLVGLCAVPLYGLLAYRMKDGFLLALATLGFFHWVGSCAAMWGRSTYAFEVDQPEVMCGVAVAVFLVGGWHQRHQVRFLRFYLVYQAVALVYLNLSLLILSIGRHTDALLWTLVFTAAALAQLVLGARLHSALLVGFGVTAAALDLFTRYFERFWDRLSLGAFLALGGAVLLGVGLALERALRGRAGGAA